MALLEMSLSAALLIVIIVIVRTLANHALPKITFVILWGIVVLRLFIPFSLPSPFHNFSIAETLNSYLVQPSFQPFTIVMPNTSIISQAIKSTQSSSSPLSISPILVIWAIGASVCALFLLIPHFKSLKEYQEALPIDHPVITQWMREHKTVQRIRIRQFDRISAPITYGVLRPSIILPKVMDWSNEKQLQFILTHELIHVKRVDVLWKWLLAACFCSHWFNPLVWVMFVLANRDIELSCDEAVMRNFGQGQKNAYALALIAMEERRGIQNLLGNHFSKNAIQERIDAIIKFKKASFTGMAAGLVVVIVAVSACATTGPFKIGISAPGTDKLPTATPIQQNQAALSNALPAANVITTATPDLGNCANISRFVMDQANNILSTEESFKGPICYAVHSRTDGKDSFVIKFNQDMDADSLNEKNIIISYEDDFTGKNFTIITDAFVFDYQPNTRQLHIEQVAPTGIDSGEIAQVLLKQSIRTADGEYFSEGQYLISFTIN